MSARPELLALLRRWLAPVCIVVAATAILLAQATVVAPQAPAPQATATPAAKPPVDDKFLASFGMQYRLDLKTEPRALRIHLLKIDLTKKRVEFASAPAEDPDGAGPATAKLTPPMTLAAGAQAIALVNANPWQSLPDAEGKRNTEWHDGMPVEILGLVVSKGVVRNAPAEGHCAFWIDRAGKPHIGDPADMNEVRESVAGFLRLLDKGRNLHVADDKIHPRTAAGLDAEGRFLTLVVVDGRQPGYSEGMNYFELADYMKSLGCTEAVNLDGGGSSIMILADGKGARQVVNDPSTKQDGVSIPRPIPVALTVRAKK